MHTHKNVYITLESGVRPITIHINEDTFCLRILEQNTATLPAVGHPYAEIQKFNKYDKQFYYQMYRKVRISFSFCKTESIKHIAVTVSERFVVYTANLDSLQTNKSQ